MAGNTINIPFMLQAQMDEKSLSATLANLEKNIKAIPPIDIKTSIGGNLPTGGAEGMLATLRDQADGIDKVIVKEQLFQNEIGETTRAITSMTVNWKTGIKEVIGVQTGLDESFKAVKGSYSIGTVDMKKAMSNVVTEHNKIIKSLDDIGKKGEDYANRSKNWSEKEKEAIQTANTELQEKIKLYKELDVSTTDPKVLEDSEKAARAAGAAMEKLISESKRGAHVMRDWSDRIKESIKQTVTYALSIGALRAAQKLLSDGIKYIIELNKEMVKIQVLQVKGAQSPEEIRSLASAFNELGKQLGVTTMEVAQGSVEWLNN